MVLFTLLRLQIEVEAGTHIFLMVALVDDWIDGKKLSQQWEAITGYSKIVDVRRLKPSKRDKR